MIYLTLSLLSIFTRQLIIQFSGSLTFEVAEVLSENAQARQFIL